MGRPLTKQQQNVYDYIRDQILERGYGPTVREIQDHMSFSSPNGVVCHLRALEHKGMIVRAKKKSRSIELTEPIARIVSSDLPCLGVLAGGGLAPGQKLEEQPIQFKSLTSPGNKTLWVGDESMQEAHIAQGDVLIVSPRETARNGELAVVRTGESILVRYWHNDTTGRIKLSAVDSRSAPVLAESIELIGVVSGVVRSM